MPVPKPAARTARSRAGRRPQQARPGRRKCAEARPARLELRRAPGRGCRRVPDARGGAAGRAGAGRRAPGRARAPRRGRRLASGAGRSHGGRAVRGAALGERRGRHGPDPRWQRHPQLRDAPALPRAAMAEFWRRSRRSRPCRPSRRPCSSRRRAPISRWSTGPPARRAGAGAASRPDPQRAAATRIAPDRTNPGPLMAYVLPEPPIAGPPCTNCGVSRYQTNPNRMNSRPAGRLRRRRPPHPGGSPKRRRARTIGSGRRRAPDSAW